LDEARVVNGTGLPEPGVSMSDAVDDLEQLIYDDTLAQLAPDPSGELAAMSLANLLIIYFNWRLRFIPVRLRRAHLSAELRSSPKYLQHQASLNTIVAKIEAGDDLNPHLSDRVKVAYEPATTRAQKQQWRKDLDLLLSEWHLHHLHLGTAIRADGFTARTTDLLFANFQEDDAYLIAILDHQGWTKMDLVTTSVHNWPSAGIFKAIRGPIALAQPVADTDRVRLRNAGVTTMLEVDGTIYFPAGQSTAGTPIAATMHSNSAMHALRELREMLRDRPDELAETARSTGFDVGTGAIWTAGFDGGWYGLREERSEAFVPYILIQG
jgi:hypothetical protein